MPTVRAWNDKEKRYVLEDRPDEPTPVGEFCGFKVFTNPFVHPGVVQIRNCDGKVIANIVDGAEIHLATRPKP